MAPKFEVKLKIRRPVPAVFDAVVRPEALAGYFVERSSGPIVAGATVTWKFVEASDAFDIVVREVSVNERIVFDWPAETGDYMTRVQIGFRPLADGETMVAIAETGWREDAVEAACGNAGGWMHMMCSLKARLEYGINLREGGAL